MTNNIATTNNIACDIAIIGGGGSAMFVANKILQLFKGCKIAICSSSKIGESSTSSAKGGINASLSNHPNEEDSWKYHAFDTIKSAKGLANSSAVEYMCKIAPYIIQDLDKMGVVLEKTSDEKISQRPYGGQRLKYGKGDFAHRACYNKDKTGKAIIDAMRANITQLTQNDSHNLIKLENSFIYDIKYCKTKSGKSNITNVLLANIQRNEFVSLSAKIFIFASGGYSGIYESATCGGSSLGHCTLSLLAGAGARLKDIEFVQFHPTSMYKFGTLVSEACRAEGGYLENENGERFLKKYDPHNMELAPRDTISKAIFNEMKNNNTKHVYLNLTHLSKQTINEKLSNAQKNAEIFCGTDISTQRLMICPAAHYSMGGVDVDKFYKIVNVSNAFAIGELACQSIHGANRLGCNSLLELFFSAAACLKGIKNIIKSHPSCCHSIKQSTSTKSALHIMQKKLNINKVNYNFLNNNIAKIRQIMDENLGIMRNKNTIGKAKHDITNLIKASKKDAQDAKNILDFVNYINFASSAFVGLAIASVSKKRKESRGSFYRSDFNKTNQKFCKNSLITLGGTMLLNYKFRINFIEVNSKISNKDLKNNVENIKYE